MEGIERIAGRDDDGCGPPRMKVLTAAEMREIDRRSMGAGVRGVVLMENAGHREPDELISRTMEAVVKWTGSSELQDDMTMVVARRV
jgi:hypothetical protein